MRVLVYCVEYVNINIFSILSSLLRMGPQLHFTLKKRFKMQMIISLCKVLAHAQRNSDYSDITDIRAIKDKKHYDYTGHYRDKKLRKILALIEDSICRPFALDCYFCCPTCRLKE